MEMVKFVKKFTMKFKISKYFLILYLLTNLVSAKKADSVLTPIIFEGNRVVTTSELEEVVGVEMPPFYVFWKDDTPRFDIKLRKKLNETFKLFYRNEGFYEANISNELLNTGVKVSIKENRPIIIKEIELKSDLDITDEFTLHKGSRFRAKEFTEMKQKLRKKLLSEGYCSPKLITKAYISLEAYAATIKVDLEKKKLCHFGKITIETHSPTMDDDIILSRLHFKEGDLFDIGKIQESYDSLYALESFDQLSLDHSRNLYNTKPVTIRYKEIQKRRHTRVGIGYATDLKLQAKLYTVY